MSVSKSSEPQGPGVSFPQRVLRALTDAASSQPPQTPNTDLFGPLGEAEKRVRKNWPEAKPSGDGTPYLDQIMKILARRLRWRERIATGGEIVWLMGKVAGVVFCFGFAWQNFVA